MAPRARASPDHTVTGKSFRFIDLFAGIGGLRQAFEARGVGGSCVFASESDRFAQQVYRANFSRDTHPIVGDIREVNARDVPDHEVLVAGFPCQPFSLAGVSSRNSRGLVHGFFDEIQGTLFFEIARIVKVKRPSVLFLENVPNLLSHDSGRTFNVMTDVLEGLGYRLVYEVVDARPWVPQGRRRIVIIAFDARREKSRNQKVSRAFSFAQVKKPSKRPVMRDILHPNNGRDVCVGPSMTTSRDLRSAWYTDVRGRVNPKYTISPALWEYLQRYAEKHRAAGNGFGFGLVGPDDIARTMSARYYKDGAEILVDQGRRRPPRRLTPRECARLMGFPESFRIPESDRQAYQQFGNSVVVPMMVAIARALTPSIIDLLHVSRRRA